MVVQLVRIPLFCPQVWSKGDCLPARPQWPGDVCCPAVCAPVGEWQPDADRRCCDGGLCAGLSSLPSSGAHHGRLGQHGCEGVVMDPMPSSSSSAFDMMAALTRFFLPRVPHIWMSGANPLQTPRAWF